MVDNRKWDVIIIGAGPAGGYAAYTLAKKGVKTLLVDGKKFPRDKSCGGLLSAKSLRILSRWETEIPSHAGIEQIRLYSREMDAIDIHPDRMLGKTVIRREFDQFIVEHAIEEGAFFQDNTILTGIEQNFHGVVINTSQGAYSARYAIGADGALSKVAELLNLRPAFHKLKMGFTYSKIIPCNTKLMNAKQAQLYFLPFLGGFGWCFPLNNAVNIGVGASVFSYRKLYHYFLDFEKRLMSANGTRVMPGQLRGAFIPCGGFGWSLGVNRILLAGDAAGGVDPFSGEGIEHALSTGSLAAENIASALNDTSFDALRHYEDEYDREFKWDRRLALLLTLISGRKGKHRFEMLRRNPDMSRWIAAIMGENGCYKSIWFEGLHSLPQYLINYLRQRELE